MKILWIPHTSWDIDPVRSLVLIEKMKQKHEIHVLTWTQPKSSDVAHFLNPKLHLNGRQEWSRKTDNLYLHHYKRFHNNRFTPYLLKINQRGFQTKIMSIVSNYGIDVIICGANYYLNGFPPFGEGVPIIFDIIDHYPDPKVSETYFRRSDAVLALSHKLLDEALRHNKNSFYLPPAIDLSRLQRGDPQRVREKHNLEGCKIVSLIGITTSPTLYLLDTLPLVKKVIPNIKYLIVGDNYWLPKMKKKARNSDDIIFTGRVEIEEVQDYFAASDVGTYPGDRAAFFNDAVPMKVLEYTAVRKPAVSSEVAELKAWNFPNVLISEPDKTDFAQKIITALTSEFDYPSLEEFRVENLVGNLEKILRSVL